jgi:hypothetical protein
MPLNKVNADSIADGTVVASDIADGTITLAKLQSGLLPSAIANSGASYANAAFATANTGTASGSYANSAFAAANTATASGSYANSAFAAANTATASGSYANSAFVSANSAFSTANNNAGVNLTQNTNITSASSYANAAFTKANTAGVGTVTSVATGNGLSGGTITSTGTLEVACPSFNSVGSYCFGGNYFNQAYSGGSTFSAGTSTNQVQPAQLTNYTSGGTGDVYAQIQLASSYSLSQLSGTWRLMSMINIGGSQVSVSLFCRVS